MGGFSGLAPAETVGAMTNAAPEAPASTDTQAAPNAADTQATPKFGDGTDGQAPAAKQEAVQTDAGKGTTDGATQTPEQGKVTPAPAPVKTAPAKTEAEIRQEIADETERTKNAEALTNLQKELSQIRQDGGKGARTFLNKVEAKYDIRFDEDERAELLNWAENLNLKALDAAKLEVGDTAKTSQAVLQRTSMAFYNALQDDAARQAFSEAVKGKDEAGWVTEFGNRQQARGKAEALTEMAETGTKLLGEGARADFTAAAKDAKDVEGLLKAYGDARELEGRNMPPADPRLQKLASGTGAYRTTADLNAAFTRGDITNEQFLEGQKAFGIGT